MSETKIILAWHFKIRTLTITLPKHNFISRGLPKIQQMISTSKTSKIALKSTIGQMGHIGFIIPWVYHFLSHLQTLLVTYWNRRFIAINYMQKGFRTDAINIRKAKEGIDMNLLARSSDSSPTSLGGYSNQGHACRFKLSDNLQFRAANNSLEFIAAIITPWIDIINGRLEQGDCSLLMTNSTTAEEWTKKSNFDKHSNDPIQATTHANAA